MENITDQFTNCYKPVKALLIYAKSSDNGQEGAMDTYVESYDIGKEGKPVNAHPLSDRETADLARTLSYNNGVQQGFLRCRGLLPEHLLWLDATGIGSAVWLTPQMEVDLFFTESLGIPSGKACVPQMIWKASRNQLSVFAFKGKRKPTADTPLYHAPFFNVHASGEVCMGTVSIDIQRNTSLEDFMLLWQRYFFGSYFSHTIGEARTTTNIVQLWTTQVQQGCAFPEAALVATDQKLRSLIQ